MIAEVEHEGLRIVGYSAGGEETYFVLPEYRIAFDVGRAPREVLGADHVFLTHGHMDHAAGLAYYFSQRMFIDNPPGNLYVPQGLRPAIQKLLALWAEIDGKEPPGNIYEAIAGQDIALRRDLVVRPFAVNHPCRGPDRRSLATLGYALVEIRRKLRDEFQGLSGPEIVAQKKSGVEVTRRIELPLVAYCGDTAPGPFLELDCVRRSRVLLLECTFFEAEHRGRARAGAHMHLDDVRELLPRLENERILLTHMTRRTSIADARAHLRRALGEPGDRRVSFFMEHVRRSRRRRTPAGRPGDSAPGPASESDAVHAGARARDGGGSSK